MILAGLNPERLKVYGCKTYCFISDEDVIENAKKKIPRELSNRFKKQIHSIF
ncbi:hypothetical protein LEP1GSC170_1792 [Leptospira interrogans serovar Bataviae str. HAI135]|nr:hypothetical protein LEP1GSC170_1792 [Leptospira interrogans serovar Bataviae str. HAI135]